jgi:hypothetical protein
MSYRDTQEKKWNKAIALKYFDTLPERIRRLINTATFDLYYGPIDENPDGDDFRYPGFSLAVDEIVKHLDLPSVLYWEGDCEELLESCPEGYTEEETGEYVEPYLENTFELDAKTIKQAVLGKELANTI